MTPISQFRPRWLDRCIHRRRYFIRNAALAALALLAMYGLWYSVTEVREAQFRVEEERRKTMLAERTAQELLDVLSGKVVMVEPSGKYAYQAEVKWQLVEVHK